MSGSDDDRTDDANDQPVLMTRIDGEEARLLVHIEPIDDAEDDATAAGAPAPPPAPDPPALTE